MFKQWFANPIKALFGLKNEPGLQADSDTLSLFHLDDEAIDALEENLIRADTGLELAMAVADELRQQRKSIHSKQQAQVVVKTRLRQTLQQVQPATPLFLPQVMNVYLVVGVNGAGKTTFIGKWAKRLQQQGHSVLIGAGDTFRAAAEDQLAVWASRAGVGMVRKDGGDASAVMFDTLRQARAENRSAVILDTAGRLQNKFNLMEELKKVRLTIARELPPDANMHTLLVLDATTGQNALKQAEIFHEAARLTGVVLTKWDGSAKGGVVLAVADKFKLPILLVGVGEGIDDLIDFDPDQFLDGLFA